MPSSPGEQYDFFLSRRGSVAAIAQEVTDVLEKNGYEVFVQDYDIQIGESWVLAVHDCIKNARDLIILFTADYEKSQYTRAEFASFWKKQADEPDKHRIVVLRCEDVQPEGLLSHNVFQDLVDVRDAEERKRRILAAAKRRSAAPPQPPGPFIGVPLRIASFTGRADELDRLDAILMRDKPAAVTQASVGRAAVQGMGGVGKTSLAIEYAHRFRGLHAGVCWCPAETRTGLLSALANLAVALGVATAEEADVERTAKSALRRLAEQRATWLLVYDNVPAPDHIADLLPSAGARVLITSRFSDWSELANEVALDVLPPEEAVALLQSRAGREDAPGARTLSEALGSLPLALDHAAAYCKRTQMQFDEYAKKALSLIGAAPRGASYPRSVAATFNLAIAEAVAQCQAAEALMEYLAQCAPERIPMKLVEGALDDEDERREALRVLAEVSLLRHDQFENGAPAVTVHRLVQSVTRARSEIKGSAQDAVGRLIAQLVVLYPKNAHSDPQSWPLCAQLTPHLLALRDGCDAIALVGEWLALFARALPILFDRASSYFHGRGAYSQAEELLRDALEIREEALGPKHPGTAQSLNNLAFLLQQQGNFARARPLYERALAIQEKALGPEHPNTANTLGNLALLLHEQGDLAEARSLYERALAILENSRGPEHLDTANSLTNLGSLLREQRDFARARPLLLRSLAVREKVLGPEHPDNASTLDQLAFLLQEQGDYPAALTLSERAVAIREKALGLEHPATASSVAALAILLHKQGDFARARPLLERALKIREKALRPEHPDTAESLHNLGSLLQEEGDVIGARPLYERALAIQEKALGPEHPNTLASLNNLARLLQEQGDFATARPLLERAVAIREKTLGLEHPDTANSVANLATLLRDQGDFAGARPLLERALAIREKTLGPEHPSTAVSLNNLAFLLRRQGDVAGAQRLYERALAIREKALDPDHPDTATSLNNLARLLQDQGDLTGARPLCERALGIREKALGPEHPDTNRTRCNLSLLLLLTRRPTEALTLGETALTAHDKVLGRDHAWTKDSARVTADALDALGRTKKAKALRKRYGLAEPEKPEVA
jgi:tetratricopeptide (TPR) repeat protein